MKYGHSEALKQIPDYKTAWDLVNKTIRERYPCPYKTLRAGCLIFESEPGVYDSIRMFDYDYAPRQGVICRITNRWSPSSWQAAKINQKLVDSIQASIGPNSGFEVSFLPSETAEVLDWILESLDEITRWPTIMDDSYKYEWAEVGQPLRSSGYFWTQDGRDICRLIQDERAARYKSRAEARAAKAKQDK